MIKFVILANSVVVPLKTVVLTSRVLGSAVVLLVPLVLALEIPMFQVIYNDNIHIF